MKEKWSAGSYASAHAIDDIKQARAAVRFQMRVPVIFRWSNAEACVQQGAGFTRDISTAGVFVYSATPPPPGAALELEVVLLLSEAIGQGMRLRGTGKVLRLEGKGERAGFAAISSFGPPNAVLH